MKKILGLAVLAAIAYFLYRRFVRVKDPLAAHLAEQAALMEIGYQKQAVNMDAQIPSSQIGDTPFAGVWSGMFYAGPQTTPKDIQLFPKGPFTLEVDPQIDVYGTGSGGSVIA